MLYSLICNDKPASLDMRMETRSEHLQWLNSLKDKGIVKLAGPFLDTQGKPDGSLVVIEAESASAAEEIASQDPYAKAGLFESVRIRPWNWVVNNPEA